MQVHVTKAGHPQGYTMGARVALCSKPGAVCPPVAHTMSNRMMDLAPSILQWWYSKATLADSFVLGPSGECSDSDAVVSPKFQERAFAWSGDILVQS